MVRRPLFGRRVVTTRERPGRLDSALASLGADVVHVPLISVEAPADADESLDDALALLGDYDWIVVTSRHGAARVGEAVASQPQLKLAAVGTRTAAALTALAGRSVDLVPQRQSAHDLVAAMAGRSGRVLVAQADRADTTLVDGLTALGFRVDGVTAYRTALRTPTWRERAAALDADAVAFASGSAAESWADSIGSATPPVVAAIGPTTAAAAVRKGLKVSHVATDHDVDGLVAVIRAALAVESVRPTA